MQYLIVNQYRTNYVCEVGPLAGDSDVEKKKKKTLVDVFPA